MPPVSHPRAARAIVLLTLVWLVAGQAVARETESEALSGIARDTIGNVLEGVEILVVRKTSSVLPVAAVHSDDAGKFRLAGLPAGPYRIAALKEGYLTFVGRINTRVESWLDVVLHPIPQLDPSAVQPVLEDASWALRLPRRSVLKETDPAEPRIAASRGGPAPAGLGETLRLHIEQMFAVDAGLSGDDPEDPALNGSETRLKLASAVSDRGSIEVLGRHESLDSSHSAPERLSTSSRQASLLRLGFSYDTSPESQLSVNAFYSQNDLDWSTKVPELPSAGAVSREQRSWGYDANWSKQLDAESHIAVRFDYQDVSLVVPDSSAAITPVVDGALASVLTNRSVGAAGRYVSQPSGRHEVQVDFIAHQLTVPAPTLSPLGGQYSRWLNGVSGLTVGVDAQDTWYVAGPFSVIYGLGYEHAITSRDTSLIAPRLGGAWSRDRLAVRLLGSYHTVTDWSSGAEEPLAWVRPADRFGYEAEVEFRLSDDARLTGSTRYSPVELQFFDPHASPFQPELNAMYVTDGASAARYNRLTLDSDSGETKTSFEMTRGTVEGNLSAVLPYEIAFYDLAPRSLNYQSGTLRIHVVPSGTSLTVDYREIEEATPSGPETAGDSRQTSIELRLVQDLLRQRSLGVWRFLMGVRMFSVETGDLGDELLVARDQALYDVLKGQVSAGLSVEF